MTKINNSCCLPDTVEIISGGTQARQAVHTLYCHCEKFLSMQVHEIQNATFSWVFGYAFQFSDV